MPNSKSIKIRFKEGKAGGATIFPPLQGMYIMNHPPNPYYTPKYKPGDIIADVSYPNDMEHLLVLAEDIDDHGRVVYLGKILEGGYDVRYDAEIWDNFDGFVPISTSSTDEA